MDDGDFVGDSEDEFDAPASRGALASLHEERADSPTVDGEENGAIAQRLAAVSVSQPEEVYATNETDGDAVHATVDAPAAQASETEAENAVENVVMEAEIQGSEGTAVSAPERASVAAVAPGGGSAVERGVEQESAEADPRPKFKVGDIVHVASRTWPGINKLGGAGKIASVVTEKNDSDAPEFFYSVKYMLGGFEKHIEEEFIQDLADALESGVRQHKERVFYHDEFAQGTHKRQKPIPIDIHQSALKANEKTVEEGAKRARKPSRARHVDRPELEDAPEIDFRERSSDDSSYESSDDVEDSSRDDTKQTYRRLNENSFIMDHRQVSNGERKRREKGQRLSRARSSFRMERKSKVERRDRDSEVDGTSRVRVKRSNRVIDSEDEIDNDSLRNRKRTTKKRPRYVGGYEHGTQDVDGSFIQPEGNPTELPEDIAKELKLKLGSTKAQLREQLDVVADNLLKNLAEFDIKKKELSLRLQQLKSLDETDLQNVNRELLELEELVRKKFIRSGEDVMNLIIKMLERKGASIPDRIDLQYEKWKERVAENDAWVKQSLRALESVYTRLGSNRSFLRNLMREEESSESSSSDFSNQGIHSGDEDYGSEVVLPYSGWEESDETASKEAPIINQGSKRQGSRWSSMRDSRSLSRRQPRIVSRAQSRIDEFAIPIGDFVLEETGASKNPGGSGFRHVRSRADQLPMDPRWDWARQLKLTAPRNSRLTPRDRVIGVRSANPLESTTRKGNHRGSESVMAAVLRLRDKRFRERYSSRSSNNRVQTLETAASTVFAQSGRRSERAFVHSRLQHRGDDQMTPGKIPWVFAEPDDNEVKVIAARKWAKLFGVLSSEEIIPIYWNAQVVPLGWPIRNVSSHGGLSDNSIDYDFSKHYVASLSLALRQKLNVLRLAEQDAVDRILAERLLPTGDKCFAQSSFWLALTALAEEFKLEIEHFVDHLIQASSSIHRCLAGPFLQYAVSELASLLKNIPDSSATFAGSPSYAYFFEVASPGSRTSPLVSTICRVYWCTIQVLVRIRQEFGMLWSESKTQWDAIIMETLPPNRVALACCLFLIDLLINVPSTHRLDEPSDNAQDLDAPALSLWLLLHDMFAEGDLQSSKSSDHGSSLWIFLQTTHQQRFIDTLGVSFVKREPVGGYMKERVPPLLPECDDSIQGRLLATDIVWDLCGVLSVLVRASAAFSTSPTIWNLVKYLLQGELPAGLQTAMVSNADIADDEFQLQSHGFMLRILRRVLVLSAIWPPDNGVLEDILPHLWNSVDEEQEDTVLYSIVDFISEIRNFEDRAGNASLYDFARRHASETTNSVLLFCKIAIVQMWRLDKTILRNRYRQPLLRAISSRVESHKQNDGLGPKFSTYGKPDPSKVVTKASASSWNWTKGGSGTPTTGTQSTLEQSSQRVVPTSRLIVAEVNNVLSMLLMFGLSSICLDDEPPQSSRRQKELKREIEYFCKELTSSSCSLADSTVQLCNCLTAIGSASLDISTNYSVVFGHVSELMRWISDQIRQLRQADPEFERSQPVHYAHLTAAAATCLQSIRDLSVQLVRQLKQRGTIDHHEFEQLEMCVTSILGIALPSVSEASMDGVLSRNNFGVWVEIMTIWFPISTPSPTKSLSMLKSSNPSEDDGFDEFDDPEMMDLLASVDIDHPSATVSIPERRFRSVQEFAINVAIDSLRLPLQKLLFSLQTENWQSFEELYLIDILGEMISSCKFAFSWSSVSISSLKPRMLAPRLLASVLHRRGDKDWFSTCYLSEPNSDVELAGLWLTSTLDLQSLFPKLCTSKFERHVNVSDGGAFDSSAPSAKYSSYWLLLTDGILASVLKDDPVVRYKMDQVIYELLLVTAKRCSFGDYIRQNSDPSDIGTLYAMHVDVFRAFCSSAGQLWRALCANPLQHRQDMNRFRLKMMDAHRGVFVALPEAYEINLKAVCLELDRTNVNWYSISSRFLDEFNPLLGADSLHLFDDATNSLNRELADPAIRPLVVLYKFMYDCLDSFLFNCGGMAIGQQNIFYSVIELMFRQARCAEFPVAEKRLRRRSASELYHPVATVIKPTISAAATSLAEISPACVGFVESVRLFFAYQKYPSLVNWFVQNLETYQTLRAGWEASPFRVLLYNVFDPLGPLGIHSYYPIQDDSRSRFDPKAVRREAFYLACGVFYCRCTKSYEHTRCPQEQEQEDRRSQLRRFILVDFALELEAATDREGENLAESFLPYIQFVKAVLNHLTLAGCENLRHELTNPQNFNVEADILPSVANVGRFVCQILLDDPPMNEAMSCVIMIEYCCIVEELIRINAVLRDESVGRVIDTGLRCARFSYMALQSYSSAQLDSLFDIEQFQDDGVDRIVEDLGGSSNDRIGDLKKIRASQCVAREDYGISGPRVRADLLSVVHRLVRSCNELGGHRFLIGAKSSPTISPADQTVFPLPHQVSVVGTM